MSGDGSTADPARGEDCGPNEVVPGDGAVDERREDPERRALSAFERAFGRRPVVLASAPGRVNLIGEHVDYAGGIVLPMPIRQRTAVAMAPSRSDRGTIASLELHRSAVVPAPARLEVTPTVDRWLLAAMGPLRELADGGVPLPCIDAVIASDVPIGAGLSSSAALACAMAAAALALVGVRMPERTLARRLQSAEHRFVGTPCGLMDFMTALAAPGSGAMRLDCRSLEVEPVTLPSSLELWLVDSGIRHELASSAYARRRAEVEEAARRLGVPSLRDATPAHLRAASLPEPLHRRARHVISEMARVDRMVAALRRGDLAQVGLLACESHASLRDDFEVSHREVDAIVEALRAERSGVLGARMVGGGFGGSVLVFARSEPRSGLDATAPRPAPVAQDGAPGQSTEKARIRIVEPGHRYTAGTVEDRPC